MTPEDRAELNRLEEKLRQFLLCIHQARLLCACLKREIRISREPKTRWPGEMYLDPFARVDKIVIFSDELTKMVGELRA